MLLRLTVSQARELENDAPDIIRLKVNDRYDLAIKNALVAAGGTGFTYPACSAAAYSSSSTYTAGQQVSYQGSVPRFSLLAQMSHLWIFRYIWEAKWWTEATPANTANGDWSASKAIFTVI